MRNHSSGGMICDKWLRLPMRDSSLSVPILVGARDSLMSFIQENSIYLVGNTNSERV